MWEFLASAAAPYLLDAITGTSKKLKGANDAYISGIDNQITALQKEMGNSASDSLLFKTTEGKIGKQSKRAIDMLNSNAASGGLTDEAKLGGISQINEGANDTLVSALEAADQQRKQIQQQVNNLMLSKLGFNVQQSQNQAGALGQVSSNISSMLPFLLRKKKPAVGEDTNVLPTGKDYETAYGLLG